MDNRTAFILLIIEIAVSQYIYWDATTLNIGKIKGQRGHWNLPAGGWAFATLLSLVGIVAAVLYALRRSDLKTKATEHPVIVPRGQRIAVSIVLLVLPILFTISSLSDK